MGVDADARVVRVRHSGRALRWLRGRYRSFRRNSSASSDKRSGNESVANPPITDTTTPAMPHRMGGTQSTRRKSPIKRAGARRPCRFGVADACAGCGTRRTEATTRSLPDKHGGSLVQRVWALRANACVRMHAHARVLRAACARVCVRLCARACVCVCICACARAPACAIATGTSCRNATDMFGQTRSVKSKYLRPSRTERPNGNFRKFPARFRQSFGKPRGRTQRYPDRPIAV